MVLSHNPTPPGRLLCLHLVTKHQARPKGIENKLKTNQTAIQRKSKQTKKPNKNLKQRPLTAAIKGVLRLQGFHLSLHYRLTAETTVTTRCVCVEIYIYTYIKYG